MSSRPSDAEVWYDLLQKLWGSQIDFTEVGTYVESKLYAVARLLAQVQGELEHAGNQSNPLKAFDQLPLLELDYLIAPPANADYVSRQRAVAAAMAFSQGEIASNVVHELKLVLGSKFLSYFPNPAGTPTVYPTNPGAVVSGNWVSMQRPAKFLQLVDPVATVNSPIWVAYEALDTSAIPTTTWSANSSFALSQAVVPSTMGAVGFYFTCTAAGITGETEPAWTASVGSTVVDGTVTWTCTAPLAPPLMVGDTVMVDGGNTSQMESVTVLQAATTQQQYTAPGNYLYFQASFTKSHDIGAAMTTGPFPYWWSTQRLAYIVLNSPWAADVPTQQAAIAVLAKILRAVCQWAVVTASTVTASGGTVGPTLVGSPMGTVPIGTFTFQNSN